jgi:hypothetical protein
MTAEVVCPACRAIIPLRPAQPHEHAFLIVACNAGDDEHTFRQIAANESEVLEILRDVLQRFDYTHVDNLRDLDTSYLDPARE